MKSLRLVNPPCPKCPYTLGHVRFVENPCPECETDGYSMYDRLVEQAVSRNKPGKLAEEVKNNARTDAK